MARVLERIPEGAVELVRNASWRLFKAGDSLVLSDGSGFVAEMSVGELVALSAIVEAVPR